jgi:hypothetical protein
LLLFVALLPWQERTVDIKVEDPVPVHFPWKAELERDLAEAENGKVSIRGYEVQKATPFGDGILIGALGGFIAIASFLALRNRRHVTLALGATAAAALIALLVGLYDAFTYGVLDDWSARHWHTSWAQDSHARIETTAAFGMFVMLVIAGYATWRSVSALISIDGTTDGHPSSILHLPSSNPS